MARSVADAAALLRALATEPGRDPDPVIAALPTRARAPGRARSTGCASPSPAVPRPPASRPTSLDGLQAARDAAERLGAEFVELTAAPDIDPEDSVTILFHEVWPYHAARRRRERYRPSIREFVDLAREVHDPARYEAAQGRRAQMTAHGARGSPTTASTSCSSPPCR